MTIVEFKKTISELAKDAKNNEGRAVTSGWINVPFFREKVIIYVCLGNKFNETTIDWLIKSGKVSTENVGMMWFRTESMPIDKSFPLAKFELKKRFVFFFPVTEVYFAFLHSDFYNLGLDKLPCECV